MLVLLRLRCRDAPPAIILGSFSLGLKRSSKLHERFAKFLLSQIELSHCALRRNRIRSPTTTWYNDVVKLRALVHDGDFHKVMRIATISQNTWNRCGVRSGNSSGGSSSASISGAPSVSDSLLDQRLSSFSYASSSVS